MHEVGAGEAARRKSTPLIILASSSDHFVIMLGALLIIFTASLQVCDGSQNLAVARRSTSQLTSSAMPGWTS